MKHKRSPYKKLPKFLISKKSSSQLRAMNCNNKKEKAEADWDDQPLTRREREIFHFTRASTSNSTVQKPKKRKAQNNRFLEEASKLGYAQLPWEDQEAMLRRISRDTHSYVNGEMLKAQFGTAGRNVEEIANEYKILDEKERIKQANIIAHKEKLKRKRQKQLEFSRLLNINKKLEDNFPETDLYLDSAPDGDEENTEEDPKPTNDFKNNSLERVSTTEEHEPKLNKYARRKLKLKEKKQYRQQEKAENEFLHAKDFIPFGEVVHQPPLFKALPVKNRSKSISMQQNKKSDLLLMNMFQSGQ